LGSCSGCCPRESRLIEIFVCVCFFVFLFVFVFFCFFVCFLQRVTEEEVGGRREKRKKRERKKEKKSSKSPHSLLPFLLFLLLFLLLFSSKTQENIYTQTSHLTTCQPVNSTSQSSLGPTRLVLVEKNWTKGGCPKIFR
jgi:hypothetical protein